MTFAQAHSGSASILVDEFKAGGSFAGSRTITGTAKRTSAVIERVREAAGLPALEVANAALVATNNQGNCIVSRCSSDKSRCRWPLKSQLDLASFCQIGLFV